MSPLGSLGRLLRSVRHLQRRQAVAQLRHVVGSAAVRPAALAGPAPKLRLEASSVPFLLPASHLACEARAGDEISIRLLAREVVFRGGVDWESERTLFAYHLHHFEYARDPALSPEARLALLLEWIENHERGVGWDPDPLSHRIFAWGKMLLTPGSLQPGEEQGAALLFSLATQVETLSRNLEVRLQANHLFTNLAAVVFGGLLLEASGAERWRAHAQGLRAELRNQIHSDGAHEERSPMYHCLLLEQVLDLLNLVRAVRLPGLEGLAAELHDTASRMCGALGVWTHPDGEIALFSDSAFDIAASPSALFAYASALGVSAQAPQSPDRLDGGGYVRLADDRWHLITSVGGPAPVHQPGHAHCDALAFELSFSGQRIVTDTGVFEYAPGVARDTARATRSHATLEIDGREQAETWAAHRVGGRPRVGVVDFQPGRSLEASCCSWSTPEVVHHRRFELSDGGLQIHDRLQGRRATVRFALPLAPGLEARLTGEPGGPRELRVALSDAELRVDLPAATEGEWRLEPRDYFPSFGRRERRWCLTGSSQRFEAGTWRFRVVDEAGPS